MFITAIILFVGDILADELVHIVFQTFMLSPQVNHLWWLCKQNSFDDKCDIVTVLFRQLFLTIKY